MVVGRGSSTGDGQRRQREEKEGGGAGGDNQEEDQKRDGGEYDELDYSDDGFEEEDDDVDSKLMMLADKGRGEGGDATNGKGGTTDRDADADGGRTATARTAVLPPTYAAGGGVSAVLASRAAVDPADSLDILNTENTVNTVNTVNTSNTVNPVGGTSDGMPYSSLDKARDTDHAAAGTMGGAPDGGTAQPSSYTNAQEAAAAVRTPPDASSRSVSRPAGTAGTAGMITPMNSMNVDNQEEQWQDRPCSADIAAKMKQEMLAELEAEKELEEGKELDEGKEGKELNELNELNEEQLAEKEFADLEAAMLGGSMGGAGQDVAQELLQAETELLTGGRRLNWDKGGSSTAATHTARASPPSTAGRLALAEAVGGRVEEAPTRNHALPITATTSHFDQLSLAQAQRGADPSGPSPSPGRQTNGTAVTIQREDDEVRGGSAGYG